MKVLSQTRRTGPFAGPVLLFFLFVLFSTSPVVFAQKDKRAPVVDSILGVGIGDSLRQAHAKLDRLSKREAHGTREEQAREEEEQEREGGRKEAWTLRTTNYSTVALQADRNGRVVWITGWLRPGKEIPFPKLGVLSSATGLTDSRAIWNVVTPSGGYRLVAKGQNGKASVVYLLSLSTPPVQ